MMVGPTDEGKGQNACLGRSHGGGEQGPCPTEQRNHGPRQGYGSKQVNDWADDDPGPKQGLGRSQERYHRRSQNQQDHVEQTRPVDGCSIRRIGVGNQYIEPVGGVDQSLDPEQAQITVAVTETAMENDLIAA